MNRMLKTLLYKGAASRFVNFGVCRTFAAPQTRAVTGFDDVQNHAAALPRGTVRLCRTFCRTRKRSNGAGWRGCGKKVRQRDTTSFRSSRGRSSSSSPYF